MTYNLKFFYISTFFYELPPALPPFCELLRVGLFNACPLMKTVHQIITESVAIVYPFHRSLVVTNLRTSNRDTDRENRKIVEKEIKNLSAGCSKVVIFTYLFYLFHRLQM